MKRKEFWIPAKINSDYEVSNLGRVRNRRSGLILKTYKNRPNGYFRVEINRKNYYVHRLVADSFYDGEHTGMNVIHVDGNNDNNEISNLKWCSRGGNTDCASKNRLFCQNSIEIVRCAFCMHRYEYNICSDKSDYFYCGYGETSSKE